VFYVDKRFLGGLLHCFTAVAGSIESSMGAILPFASKQTTDETAVEAAWRELQTLVKQRMDDPGLLANLDHCMATARALQKFENLFLAEDAA